MQLLLSNSRSQYFKFSNYPVARQCLLAKQIEVLFEAYNDPCLLLHRQAALKRQLRSLDNAFEGALGRAPAKVRLDVQSVPSDGVAGHCQSAVACGGSSP